MKGIGMNEKNDDDDTPAPTPPLHLCIAAFARLRHSKIKSQ